MDLDAGYWAGAFAEDSVSEHADKSGWDARSSSFAHKPKRSDYIAQLIEHLDLQPDESVFDMGCGPGTLSIPLAQQGHTVHAVDFSTGMLEQLQLAANEAGVEVDAHQRSWQEDWGGLPQADVAISSRSLITHDLADAIAKLESKARNRVAITSNAGQVPWLDFRVERMLGRERDQASMQRGFVAVVNYLFSIDRLPRVDYIEYPTRWAATDRDALVARMMKSLKLEDSDREKLKEFVDEHIEDDPVTGGCRLDYERLLRWGYVCWDV